MANDLFRAMSVNAPMGQFGKMMQQFQQFRNGFTGDPRAAVEQIVRDRGITQQQLNQFQQMATQFQSLMK